MAKKDEQKKNTTTTTTQDEPRSNDQPGVTEEELNENSEEYREDTGSDAIAQAKQDAVNNANLKNGQQNPNNFRSTETQYLGPDPKEGNSNRNS